MIEEVSNHEIKKFISSVIKRETGYLKQLEEYAVSNHIPIISPEAAALLKILIKIHKPGRILEIGTAVGYSACIMAKAFEGAKITTLEIDEAMTEKARETINKMKLEKRIHIIQGDALEIMQCLSSKFDMIFLDGPKGQYIEYIPEILRLLKAGGLLVSDNVLYKGLVAKEGTVMHKHRTIAVNLKRYLYELCSNEELDTSIIPIGDGMAISYRKGEINE
jgi:predicted O-methyltransferase YrrM